MAGSKFSRSWLARWFWTWRRDQRRAQRVNNRGGGGARVTGGNAYMAIARARAAASLRGRRRRHVGPCGFLCGCHSRKAFCGVESDESGPLRDKSKKHAGGRGRGLRGGAVGGRRGGSPPGPRRRSNPGPHERPGDRAGTRPDQGLLPRLATTRGHGASDTGIRSVPGPWPWLRPALLL